MLWYDSNPRGDRGSPLPPQRAPGCALPSWVEAGGLTSGQRRYLHLTGAEILVDACGRVRLHRAPGYEAERALDEAEQWLVHVGYRWLAGSFQDTEVIYLAPGGARGGG